MIKIRNDYGGVEGYSDYRTMFGGYIEREPWGPIFGRVSVVYINNIAVPREMAIPGTDLKCRIGDVFIRSDDPSYNEEVLRVIEKLEDYQQYYPKYYQFKKAELAIKENNDDYEGDYLFHFRRGKDCLYAVMKPKYNISIKDIKIIVEEDYYESQPIDWTNDEYLPLWVKNNFKESKSIPELRTTLDHLAGWYDKIPLNFNKEFDITFINHRNQMKSSPNFLDSLLKNIFGLRFYLN